MLFINISRKTSLTSICYHVADVYWNVNFFFASIKHWNSYCEILNSLMKPQLITFLNYFRGLNGKSEV
jgi:hypothetical protein